MTKNKQYTYLNYSKDGYIGSFYENDKPLTNKEVWDILNEQKKEIEYLETKIKENEWHWNTIDEDRDVWHYKCNQAEEKVKELKKDSEKYRKLTIQFDNRNKELIEENEQLKQDVNNLMLLLENQSIIIRELHFELIKHQLKEPIVLTKEDIELMGKAISYYTHGRDIE